MAKPARAPKQDGDPTPKDAPLRRVLALRHVAFEDLGGFVPPLILRGFGVRYVDSGYDALDPKETDAADLLVVLGGPIGANDEADYPWLKDEIAAIERRLKAGKPVLGLCLGAQLIARALGAKVYPNKVKEIGFKPITLTDAGRASSLAALDGAPILHWHGDTFDLPKDARHLASTDACAHQAFAWGERDIALALQFHPEGTARDLERWFVGHVGELAAEKISVPALRAEAAQHDRALRLAGAKMLVTWLNQVFA
ncbi:MAG TPA: glutamine amidotransferase [Alphaproteobacteria bacterium]|nr:glutamine amidotransferase [Alphaproteobacteria bacterium]